MLNSCVANVNLERKSTCDARSNPDQHHNGYCGRAKSSLLALKSLPSSFFGLFPPRIMHIQCEEHVAGELP